MEQDIILKIQSMYNSMTKSGKTIADFVFMHSEEVMYCSITELSERIKVGEASIIRFCRFIGLKGFQEFKLSLAKTLVNPEMGIHEKISINDSLESLVNKITEENTLAVENTKKILSIEQLDRAADSILRADKTVFFGVGPSAYTAMDAKYKFMRLGLNVDANIDSHVQQISSLNIKNRDAAVGISFSGSTYDTVEALKAAKQSGASTIAITNYSKSPITAYSDTILLSAARETPLKGGELTAKIVQIHLIDILFSTVAIRMQDKAIRNLEITAEAITKRIY